MNAGMLWYGLRKSGIFQWESGWGVQLGRMLLSNLLMVGVLIWLVKDVEQWLSMDVWSRIFDMALLVFAGGGVYILTLVVAGLRPRHLKHA